MENQQRYKQRPKNAMDHTKLRLTAPPPQGGNRRPAMAFSVVNNNPRIDVYTNIETDKDGGKIRAAMDTPVFFSVLELIQQAIDSTEPFQRAIENKNHKFFNGKRSEKPETISKTIVGKDEEGRVFISVVAKGVTPVKFIFTHSYYHNYMHRDGSPVSEAEVSVLMAKSYLKMLQGMIPSVLTKHYVEPPPRDNNNNRGGGNRGGGYGGGQQQQERQPEQSDTSKPSADYDKGDQFSEFLTDDFPM